jgi:hypothetical protein
MSAPITGPVTSTRRWLRTLRVVVTAQTFVTFLSAVTAGVMLTVHRTALHSAASYALWSIAVVHVVLAVLSWHPGRGSGWPAVFAAAFLVGVSLQVVLGIAHLKELHVPLGVLLFAGTVLETAWIWMPHPTGAHRSRAAMSSSTYSADAPSRESVR